MLIIYDMRKNICPAVEKIWTGSLEKKLMQSGCLPSELAGPGMQYFYASKLQNGALTNFNLDEIDH